MRFVDEARIQVRAGKGGHGCLSFRREKFVPRGGPDGGNGGDGGSVYLKADNRLLSLYDFRLKRLYEAQNGRPGEGSQCDGRKGENLVLVGRTNHDSIQEKNILYPSDSSAVAAFLRACGGRL